MELVLGLEVRRGMGGGVSGDVAGGNKGCMELMEGMWGVSGVLDGSVVSAVPEERGLEPRRGGNGGTLPSPDNRDGLPLTW